MVVFPNAKINLGLRITEKRKDGFHNLETIFYPIEVCDALDVVKSDRFRMDITGRVPEGKAEDNLVVQAYALLKKDFDLPPVHIHLHKKIPFGTGLGGGSSDAAFMLSALNSLFSLNLKKTTLATYAKKLGADCPFFVYNTPALATGIGNILTPVNVILTPYHILVVVPPFPIHTAEAYRNVHPAFFRESLTELITLPVSLWREKITNAFEDSLFPRYPVLSEMKNTLYNLGAVYASMTGSGSALYGLFSDPPEFAQHAFPEECLIYR
jgi:4-diphosphocytidyl-2-C-methyl-D-erythritol kinase